MVDSSPPGAPPSDSDYQNAAPAHANPARTHLSGRTRMSSAVYTLLDAMQFGTPVTSAWLVLWIVLTIVVAIGLSSLIYRFGGNVPFQP